MTVRIQCGRIFFGRFLLLHAASVRQYAPITKADRNARMSRICVGPSAGPKFRMMIPNRITNHR